MCLHSFFQSDDLLIQHGEPIFHHHVLMVVSEKPVFEAAAFSNFIKKVRQDIPLVQSTTECILDAAEAAVGYDVIYILTHCPAFLLLSGILPRWAVPLSIR